MYSMFFKCIINQKCIVALSKNAYIDYVGMITYQIYFNNLFEAISRFNFGEKYNLITS